MLIQRCTLWNISASHAATLYVGLPHLKVGIFQRGCGQIHYSINIRLAPIFKHDKLCFLEETHEYPNNWLPTFASPLYFVYVFFVFF